MDSSMNLMFNRIDLSQRPLLSPCCLFGRFRTVELDFVLKEFQVPSKRSKLLHEVTEAHCFQLLGIERFVIFFKFLNCVMNIAKF